MFRSRPVPLVSELRGHGQLIGLGSDVAGGPEHKKPALTLGKEADLTLFDLNAVLPMQGRFTTPDPAPEAIAALMIYRGGHHALRAAWVRGRQVAGA